MVQAVPAMLPMQLRAMAGLHWAQLLLTQRLRPSERLPQCMSVVHSTHWAMALTLASLSLPPRQYGAGTLQSLSRLQVAVHIPIMLLSEVHESPSGQPLRPAPVAQPWMQRRVMVSQTRPEPAPPQSLSWAHPQRPSERHALPLMLPMQAPG